MAIGSGLSGQIGFVAETEYGTAVTVTRFLELDSESIKADIGAVENFSMSRGRVLRSGRRKTFTRGVTGSVSLPVMTKGMNLLFKQMLGTHGAAQQSGTSEYLHTSTVDLTTGKTGVSMTVQVGRPDVTTPTVNAFTYAGMKVVGWELSCELDGKLMLNLDLDGKSEVTNVALASASYATGDEWFTFNEGGASLGGSAISIRSFSIKSSEGLNTDRRFLGNGKKDPIANAQQEITITLDPEFEALTLHGNWKAGDVLSNLILTFDTGDAIPSGNGSNFKLVITIPKLMLISGGPTLNGAEVLRQPFEAKALYDGTNNPLKIENWTTDNAA